MQASVKLLPKFKPLSPPLPLPAELLALPALLLDPATVEAPPLVLPALPLLDPATPALPLAPLGPDEDGLPQPDIQRPADTRPNPRPQPLARIAILPTFRVLDAGRAS